MPALTAPRPNILFIMTDQQSVYALRSNGNRDLHTPAMDSLARAGGSFTESYSTYPVCSPARSSLFTSRMPHETGVRDNGKAIRAGMPTMGEHFRAAGYQTVYAGKWHLPKSFADPQGFDLLVGGSSQGADMDEPVATTCVRHLLKKPQQPFLMVASFMNPHDVCEWIRKHPGTRPHPDLTGYPQARLNMAIEHGEPEYIQHHRTAGYNLMSSAVGIASEWNAADFRHYLHDYYRMVESVDRQIGRLLEALRLSGLDRNTLVILTADHGEGLGSHRWVQKAAFWEETVKVPLILAGHGIPRRGIRDDASLVSGLDVFPTMCDYAGIAPPAALRGMSLRPAMEGKPWRRQFVVSELSVYGGPAREGRMLRSRRYKYVVFNGGERPEQLFDLEFDPGETRNLAGLPGSAAILNRHRTALSHWIQETQDDFQLPKP
jgi:arylsulfatase A-like enzyme